MYGDLPANEFYPLLFADTAQSVLTLRKTLHDIDGADATVAFWFDFAWTLADGTPAPFTAVDVAELDDTGRITHLHIVYDTHPIREAWEAQQQLSKYLRLTRTRTRKTGPIMQLKAEPHRLHNTLGNRHVTMIAIGGTIGTGLFLGSGMVVQQAAPLSSSATSASASFSCSS